MPGGVRFGAPEIMPQARACRSRELLSNIMLYWVTGAINSSFWPYYDRCHAPWPIPDGARITVPTAYAASPRAERVYNIRCWTPMPAGGHFAALEEPEALAAKIRAFSREL